MRLLAIANIEKLEGTSFFVLNLYGQKGYLIDQIIAEYENENQAATFFSTIIKEHKSTLDCWTSTREIYALTLTTPGVAGTLKHSSDTEETAKCLIENESIIRELHEIIPLVKKTKLSKVRKRLFLLLQKFTDKVGGNGAYEI